VPLETVFANTFASEPKTGWMSSLGPGRLLPRNREQLKECSGGITLIQAPADSHFYSPKFKRLICRTNPVSYPRFPLSYFSKFPLKNKKAFLRLPI
jgi:hypothetical protein